MTQDNSSAQLVERLREALEKCRDKFAEYVKLHSAKLLPERAADEFYQNARTAHNAEVCEKVRRNQEMVDLCDQALANPATIRDTDEDAEGRERVCELIEYLDAMSQPGFVIGGRRLYTDDLRPLLASSTPAEPREASGYCPFCMTADPVAPAEPDEPSEARRLRKRYDELLYAVSRKFEGEDRHETALRYIREAEADFDDRPAQSQRKAEPDASGERKC